MRVIKFRAWVKTENKMLHWGSSLISMDHELNVDSICARTYRADDMELMQFTGLLDKNDEEIYESDVVQITELYGDQQQANVFWGPVTADYEWVNGETWLLHFTSGAEGPLYPYCKPRNYYQLEVIGNIYENPELARQL